MLGRTAGLLTAAALGSTAVPGLSGGAAYAATPVPGPPAGVVQDALRRYRSERDRIHTGKPSANGWEMQKATDAAGDVWTRPLPGTGMALAVRLGDVERVLVHVVRRFHYEIDTLRPGDVVGWRRPAEVKARRPESNHASGTAVAIRPGSYPPGARGGFFSPELTVIRDILAELRGVVRWGGDDATSDEALFYIGVPPGDPALAAVAAQIEGWRTEPGAGAGAPVDVLSTRRRSAAVALEHRQR